MAIDLVRKQAKEKTATELASTIPLDPTVMSDSVATRLGLKIYRHGFTYNGGNAPTITCPQAGFSVGFSALMPYQMQDGSWRLRANIRGNFTSASVSSLTFSFNGVTFSGNQAGAGFIGAVACRVGVNPSNNITLSLLSATTTDTSMVHLDVQIDAKPTWAY